jgi:hypothetical protein
MADNLVPILLHFNGGFATDFPDQTRALTYQLKAENVMYEVDGGVRKSGGTEFLFSDSFSGLPSVNGMTDFWLDTSGTVTQNFIMVTASGEIYKDDLDGTFTAITGTASLGSDPIPIFCVAQDILTIWFSNNTTPLKYTGTGNVSALGGTPPVGRGAVYHMGRLWAWGTNAAPSRLYYSAFGNIEDWSGIDTGSIDIQVGDGDRIVGAISFREKLFIFKGPNIGSIHTISGTAPTGSDSFSRKRFSRGIPLQTHNSLLEIGNDILFMSPRGIHSLAATEMFGSFTGKEETRFLKKFFREQINTSRLNRVWAVDYSQKSCAMWAMTAAGSSTNDKVLGLSYIRHEEEGYKPFTWSGRSCVSAAIRKSPTTDLDEVIFGTNVGSVLRQDTLARAVAVFATAGLVLDTDSLDTGILGGSVAGVAYNMHLRTPQILIGQHDALGKPRPDQSVTLYSMYMRSISVGNHDINVSLTRDNEEAEQYKFNQGQSSFRLDRSSLDVGTLGGEQMRLVYSDPPVVGSCRALQIEITQGGLSEDAHILEMCLMVKPEALTHESI